jgi:hypothetical protein
VIFYDTTDFQRGGFLPIISINPNPSDIWFFALISLVLLGKISFELNLIYKIPPQKNWEPYSEKS